MLISMREAIEVLEWGANISGGSARQALRAGLAGPGEHHRDSLRFSAGRVAALANRPAVDPDDLPLFCPHRSWRALVDVDTEPATSACILSTRPIDTWR